MQSRVGRGHHASGLAWAQGVTLSLGRSPSLVLSAATRALGARGLCCRKPCGRHRAWGSVSPLQGSAPPGGVQRGDCAQQDTQCGQEAAWPYPQTSWEGSDLNL